MACRQDCMQLACIHVLLCCRPGFVAAGPEVISASRAPHVRARGMTCCMDIASGMDYDVRMLSMLYSHAHALACRPLCARACRRGAVLMKDGVFGHQTNGKDGSPSILNVVRVRGVVARAAWLRPPRRLTVTKNLLSGKCVDTLSGRTDI